MTTTTKSVLTFIKEYLLITVGIGIYVLGWSIFLVPNNLVGGGVTGIASIIQYATHGAIKMGTSYFVINLALLILALFTLGRNFGGKTVYAIILASVGLNILQSVIPAEIPQILAVDNGKLMSTLMAGIMVGVGIGITFSQGGSTGGTDIIALVVNKYRNVSPGRMILATDSVIILSSLLVPSFTPAGELMPWPEKITTVVYGFILVAVASTVLDFYLAGSKQSVQVFILSKKYAEIADAVTHDLHRGVTVLDGKGWYTKESTEVVMVMMRKTDLNLLLRYVKSIDPNAFLSVSSVTGVYGKGFDIIKTNNNRKRDKEK
ncbi:MAG: YitT family protein [Bacteroidales bacterium]|nr:YitT family protein [Bacteroidales bacterium]